MPTDETWEPGDPLYSAGGPNTLYSLPDEVRRHAPHGPGRPIFNFRDDLMGPQPSADSARWPEPKSYHDLDQKTRKDDVLDHSW